MWLVVKEMRKIEKPLTEGVFWCIFVGKHDHLIKNHEKFKKQQNLIYISIIFYNFAAL